MKKKTLREFDIKASERLLLEKKFVPIGLKTKTNIWDAGNYTTEDLNNESSEVNWLPKIIKSRLENTEFDN